MTLFLTSPVPHAAIDRPPTCSRRRLDESPCQALQPRALDFESCRDEVHQAAMAKLVAGNSRSVKQCLLEVGFTDSQANNRTMQSRVRRHVTKLRRRQEDLHGRDPTKSSSFPANTHLPKPLPRSRRQRQREFVPPTSVIFSNKRQMNSFGMPDSIDDDNVSVLTEGSGLFDDPMTSSTVSTVGTTIPTSIPREIHDIHSNIRSSDNFLTPTNSHGLHVEAISPRLSPVTTTRAVLELRNALQQQQLRVQQQLGSIYSTPLAFPNTLGKTDALIGSNLHRLLEQPRLPLIPNHIAAAATHEELLRQAALTTVTPVTSSRPLSALSSKVRLSDYYSSASRSSNELSSSFALSLSNMPPTATRASAKTTTSIFQ